MNNEELSVDESRRLAQLLDLNNEKVCLWSEEELVQMLEHQLSLRVVNEITSVKDVAVDTTFLDLLTDSKVTLSQLRAIKDYGRTAGLAAGPPREIGVILYVTAIVLARARHRVWITGLNENEVAERIEWVKSRSWVRGPILSVFDTPLS